MGTFLGVFCGNKTGQNLLVTEDKVEMTFRSDDRVEQRGYYGTRDSNFQYAKTDFVIFITIKKPFGNKHCHDIVASVVPDWRILVNPVTGLMDFLSEVCFGR